MFEKRRSARKGNKKSREKLTLLYLRRGWKYAAFVISQIFFICDVQNNKGGRYVENFHYKTSPRGQTQIELSIKVGM